MGFLSHVGLLLWKNAKLKIRSPLLTITTLSWPIILFIIVLIVRTRLPPTPDKECHFKPQALPSVGTADFMQSMMCDLETKCLQEDEVPKSNEPPSYGASIGQLLQDLDPLVSEDSTFLNGLESLPATLRPLINLTETLEDIFNSINEQDIYLKDFFTNDTRLREVLLQIFDGAEADFINAMLGARINILELLDIVGYSDAESLVCNETALRTFITFPPNTNVENIASALCDLTTVDVENILNIILDELDVQYITDEVTAFLRALDRYGLDNFTRDVLDIREQLENITALGDFVDVLPQLIRLTQLAPEVQRFLEAIQGGSVEQTLYTLQTLIANLDWEGSPSWWSDVQNALLGITNIIASIFDTIVDVKYGDVTFKDVFSDSQVIESMLQRFNLSQHSLGEFLNSTFNIDRISDFIKLLRDPNPLLSAYCNEDIGLDDFLTTEGAVDESSLRETLCKVDNGTTLFKALLEEFRVGRNIMEIIQSLNDLFEPVSTSLDLGPLINKTQELLQDLDQLPDFLKDLPAIFSSLDSPQIAPLLDLAALFQNGSSAHVQEVLVTLLVESSTMIESMFVQHSFWPFIQSQLAYQLVILDTETAVIQRILDGALVKAFQEDPFTQVGELFLELGPNITEAVLATFLDPDKIEEFISLPPQEQELVFCSDFIEYPPGLDVTYAKQELCKLDLAELYPSHVEVWASYFPEVVYAIDISQIVFSGNISLLPEDLLANATFKNVIMKHIEFQSLLDDLLNTKINVEDFFASLMGSVNVTGAPEEWNAMLNRLTASSIPSLQNSVLTGDWESVLEYIGEIPESHSFLAALAVQDVVIQDLNIVFSIFNDLSREVVPPYGYDEMEKFLSGIVFLTQEGSAILDAVKEALQDPVKAVDLNTPTKIAMVLCNAEGRDSILDITSVDISDLDVTLCSLNFDLLINETAQLMQLDELAFLFHYIKEGSMDPLNLNLTAVTIHTNQLVQSIGRLDESWQNWIELVMNGSDWLSLVSHFVPEVWMHRWNAVINTTSIENLSSLFKEVNPKNLTILIEDLVLMYVPNGVIHLDTAHSALNAAIEIIGAINNAFNILEGLSEGMIITELEGTQTAKVFEAVLEVDLLKLGLVLSDSKVIGVLTQVGYLPFFCNATIRDTILDLPGKGIDTSLFDRTICTVDWKIVGQELESYILRPDFMSQLIVNGTTEYSRPSEIDWQNAKAVLEAFVHNMAMMGDVALGLGDQLGIQGILEYYEKQWLTDVIGLTPTNISNWREVLNEQLNMIWQQIDVSLSEVPGWQVYRANVFIVISTIQQIIDLNSTLDFQPFTLASILPNVTEFTIILSEIPNLTDDVIYQLLYTPIDPMMILELASTNSWNETLCNTDLLSGVFIEPEGINLTQIQGALCGVDFEAVIGQLSQGVGIEYFVSVIIDQITTFSGGDDFGIGDYNPAEWASRIEKLIGSFDVHNPQGFTESLVTQFLAIYEDINALLINVTGWTEFKADLSIILYALQYAAPYLGNGTNGNEPISLSMLVPNVTELEILLGQNTQLSSDIIQTLLYTAINPVTLIEVAVTNNWNETLCTEDGLRALFITPEGFNLTEISSALCSVGFESTLMELMQDGAFENIVVLIVDQLYASLLPAFALPPELDLSVFIDLIPKVLSMIQEGGTQNIAHYFESLNSLSAMFANESWYQDVIRQLQFMDFITKAFTDKLIMFEGRTITFPNLGNLLANTSELQKILLEDHRVGLGLLEAIMTLSLQPNKLTSFFNMSTPLMTLCATGQFSSFFYSPLNPDLNITELEQVVCQIDSQKLVMELKDLVSFDDILEQIYLLNTANQTASYNWTAGYVIDERLSQAITQLAMNPPRLSFEEVWVNKTLETLIDMGDRWTKAQERLLEGVPSDIARSLDSLSDLLEHGVMSNQSWAVEMSSALRTMNAVLDYINNKLWMLPGRNITLQDLLPPDIATYIEANSDLTPDIIALILQASADTEALLATNDTWLEVICSDVQSLPMMFQVPADVDLEAAHQALCSIDFDQWTMAYMQEIQSILIDVQSGKEVNISSIMQNFQTLALGIQTLIENPPNLLKYDEDWFLSIIERVGAIAEGYYNETQVIYTNPDTIPMLFNALWTELSVSNPSLLASARLNDYITQVLIDMLSMLPGRNFTLPRLEELFGDTTYVRELLSHSDIAPEIIDTFVLLAVEPEKIAYLTNTPGVFVELCQSGQFSSFFQLPPDSPTNITVVEEAVCTTNLTLVLAELDQKFMFTGIVAEINRIIANDPTLPPFNQTAASLRMMALSNLITALIQTPPQVTIDPVWWESVYNRSEVIILQWLQRLSHQVVNGSSLPGLDMVLAQLRTLDIPGFDVDQIEAWINQSQYIQGLITQAITASPSNEFAIPTFQELFPDPSIIVQQLAELGVPSDVIEAFLLAAVQADQWTQVLVQPDPLQAICNSSLFEDIFIEPLNASIDLHTIQESLCNVNLTWIDAILYDLFGSNPIVIQLVQIFYQVPEVDLETALNVSREISGIISSLISDPTNFEVNPESIIQLLQSLQVPGLNSTIVQDWLKQIQLMQYINGVINDWLVSNNGTDLAVPTFSELFPDPSIIVQQLSDLGVSPEVIDTFLLVAVQADQWTQVLVQPDPLQAICNSSLFEDIFIEPLNASIDLHTIQESLCNVNLTWIDAILYDLFGSNPIVIQLVQIFYQVPEVDLETALNVSREISGIISSLISDPANFEFNPESIIQLLQSLQVPGLNSTIVQDWLKQIQLMQYINGVINEWLVMNNGTDLAVPTFSELFPDPSIIVQQLSDLGVSPEVIDTFLLVAVQADQWTQVLLQPDPLQAICNSSLFEDIFIEPLNASIDLHTIQESLCIVNLTWIDAILYDLFGSNPIVIQLVQIFYQVPQVDLETALNVSREISGIISSLISDPTNFEVNPESIIQLLQSLQVPGLNSTIVQDWLKQIQLMQYINGVINDWLVMNNGTDLAVPTFNELFPDPSIIVQQLSDLGVSSEVIDAFLLAAVQADQWTQIWLQPDPLQAICDSANLFEDIFIEPLNASIDLQTIQTSLCNANLTWIDAVLSSVFQNNPIIIQLSQLLFQDPSIDWHEAWNTSQRFSQMFDELFQNQPIEQEDIKQLTLSLFNELEAMLRMYGVWDDAEHILKYIELYLQGIGHHLNSSNNFLQDLLDPTVPLSRLVQYVGMTPEEIQTALLGEIRDIRLLAELYYLDGDWDSLFYCKDDAAFKDRFGYLSDDGNILNMTAVREVYCSLNISEFFETAKNLYGFDFLRLTELGYIRSRMNSTTLEIDLESLVDLASDIAQLITDLVHLPSMLTQDIDMEFLVMRLTNLSDAITAQDYEQLLILLDELAPLLQSPDVVYQIKASLMSGSDIMSWLETFDYEDPVESLERIEGALNETLLWHTILPALDFVGLLVDSGHDALNPLGYRFYDILTNETILQQYLTEMLGLAPEYAEAITLSGVQDVFMLASHHLSGTWETTYCTMPYQSNYTSANYSAYYNHHLNLTAVYTLLCNLDRDQFFESASAIMGIDVLGLTQWISDLTHPEAGIIKRFHWETLTSDIQSSIDMLDALSSIGSIGGVNVTQVLELTQKLQEGLQQFDYQVLIEQMEVLNQILNLNGEWGKVKGYMNAITSIVEWLNLQLQKANADQVTIIEMINHHSTALQNLYNTLGYDLFSQLITAMVDPQEANKLNTHDDIEKSVCDVDSFNDLLEPTVMKDTTSLQQSLCAHLMSGHPTIADDLMTHFNIAPLQHEIAVLATNNHGKGFGDPDVDMEYMINQFEELSSALKSFTFYGFMDFTSSLINSTILPSPEDPEDLLMMISGGLSELPALPLWNEIIYPIVGRLDLAMIMVDDLFFSLPEREADIQAILDNETIVNAAIPVILTEVPNVIVAWNQVMQQPLQVPVLSKLILELLKGGDLEGVSDDPTYLYAILMPNSTYSNSSVNTTVLPPPRMGPTPDTAEAMVELIVALDRMLLTDFGQQLVEVFRIRENADRLDIITDTSCTDLHPFDASMIGRAHEFVMNSIYCVKNPSNCMVHLEAPATLELLVQLAEVATQLPAGSLESLGDVFSIFGPILEEFLQQTENGTSELEQSLNTAFTFLMKVFEANKIPLDEVLSIWDFENAFFNSSIVYDFLRENTDLSEIDFIALKNGSINTSVIFELWDLGAADSINVLCQENLIDALLLNIDIDIKAEITGALCSNASLDVVDFLHSNIDLKTIVELISQTADETFPEFLLSTLDSLISLGNDPDVDYNVLGEFVTLVIPALFENGLPSIFDLGSLAENINITRRALHSMDVLLTVGKDLLGTLPNYDDVQRLVRTLLDNLYVIELLAEIPDLTVRNILRNELVLEDYLVENTDLRRNDARDLTYSSFNLEQLFSSEVTGFLDDLCNPDYLGMILLFSNQTNVTVIADTMCGLSPNQIATLLSTLLPHIDVSALVNVSNLGDDLGSEFIISNRSIQEVMQSIDSLDTITGMLPALEDALSNFNDLPAVEELRRIANTGALTGGEISAVTQDIVCGRSSERKRRDAQGLVRSYDRSTTENDDGFCQNIFSSLVTGFDGRLVWAYLKPIVEGSILYSPDIPPVRRIIEKANATFENIAQTQRFADAWLAGGGDLQTILDPDTLSATKMLLENSYVQGFLETQYDIDAGDFTGVFDGTLASMSSEQIQTLNLLAELVSNLTRCFDLNRFVGYANEAAMVHAARNLDTENTLLAAVAFDIDVDATDLPMHIKYKIRMDTDNTPPTDRLRQKFLPRVSANDFVFDLRYLRGYIMLQDMIEGSIISLQASADVQLPGVYLQMTPYPCHILDYFGNIFALILPLVMTISFIIVVGIMTHQLVYEKERGIEELMKVMGLPSGANWWAWFISNSIILLLLSCIIVIIITFGNILPMTDWTLLLVFILDYFFSMIMLCYLASALFQRASIAALASIIMYSLFYLPYLAVFASESLLDTLWKPIVTSLFCPSTFSIGCVVISQFENLGVGAQWDLIWHQPYNEEVTTMGLVLIALAVDGGIYLLLGWYIKTLFPGKYGVPRCWYFPLQLSFWFNCSVAKRRDMTKYMNSAYDPESGVDATDQGSVVEEEPSNHPIGIAILNLTKVYRSCFKKEKVAVDNLTLNFFEGQVTALLGHNGAGKTTTINIITGLFSATSGKVYLHGINVAKKASYTRENLGVCVQHNALYGNLTVREHMAMTGRVKGLIGKELDDDIYTLLEDVGLLKKSAEKVKNLSGGMKRKLAVAMAFVGHSSIVILDEPTSGVDPHARRAIWNLIIKHKTGRTIVLCTHFMDEADILGDRIAILDQGHLCCCGSPAFLKARFSSGYKLSLAKDIPSGTGTPLNERQRGYKTEALPNIYGTVRSGESDVPSTSSGVSSHSGKTCDPSDVTDFIQTRIPSAHLEDDIGTELVYVLPVEHGEREKFQGLFEDLDNNLEELHIKSYGISDTTLKEVFLKVSTNQSTERKTAILSHSNWSLRKPGQKLSIATGITRNNAYELNQQHDNSVLLNAWGILIKRLHFVRRDWQGFIWTVIMPVILVALAIGFSQLNQINREQQRELTPAMFNPNSYVFFSDESESEIGQRLKEAAINPPGLGTTCLQDADQMELYPCTQTNSHTVDQLRGYNLTTLSVVPEDQCMCTDTGFGWECLPDAGGIPPPTWLTDSYIHLQDISVKEDKERYLLDSQQKFSESRFGGVSWFDVEGTNQTQTKAWYNNRAFHAMPTFLNVMNNIILRATVSNNSDKFGITAYNHPLELSKQDLGEDLWLEAAKTFGIVIVLMTALVLIPSAFSMFLVTENLNGSKRLHYVSGVGTLTYWLTNLIWDMLRFCIPLGLMLVVFYIFDFRGLILASNVGPFVALALLYGFAVMTQIYIFVPFFKEAGSALIFLFCVLLLEAIVTNLPNWLVAVNAVSETEKGVIEILNYVFLVFPPYCISSGMLELIQNQATADIYKAFGVQDGIYEEPFILLKWHLIALAAEGGLAFLVLIVLDAVRNSNCSSCLDPNVDETSSSYHDNEDVMEEKEAVLGGGSSSDALMLEELRKVYRGPSHQNIVAVNDLCLGVSKGECFGLLGVNGAGKTSTFRMIVGDLSPTEGTIKRKAKSIGYCPQENAMYPQLTGEELLYCYARLKGIHSCHISKAITEISEELAMDRYLKKRISTYSGGMKRTLAVAVALLGKPELVLMDEPTTGMDPITKQRVLTSIINVVRDNRSVILTSHSMEECEAVCTRLAIMVNGEFCCLGSPQHVKNRHGNGYTLVVRGQKTEKTDMSLVKEFVYRSFPGAEMKEHHHNVIRFQLPPFNITVATIFGIMEAEKSALNLEDYSVSQTTLDEVFVNFAKKQTDGLEDDASSTGSTQEVTILNRAFEPDEDLEATFYPRNSKSVATQF